MATELEKLLADDKKEVAPALEEKKPEAEKPKVPPPEENPEAKKAEEHLANIRAAIKAEGDELKKIRDEKRKVKKGTVEEEEEIPQIDDKDPSSKAWTKRINDAAAPAQQELEKAKDERRLYTLKQFLQDKPALAKSPEKLRAMMQTYERLKTSTELTNEGIMMDLEKAYAAENAEELISAAREGRVDAARSDALFSSPGVSRGSTAYSAKEEGKPRVYTEEELKILAKWNSSPAEQSALEKEQQKKAAVG